MKTPWLLPWLLLSLPCAGRGDAPAPNSGEVAYVSNAYTNPAPPVTFTACPDAPAFAAVAGTIRPGLWPSGATWTVQECDEGAWARLSLLLRKMYHVDTAQDYGLTLYGDGGHRIYIRQLAPGTTPAATFAHELGHVLWPQLFADGGLGGQGYAMQMVDWFGKGQSQDLAGPGQSDAEEAFANAFSLNRTARAATTSGSEPPDWGQTYIDGVLCPAWDGLTEGDGLAATPALLTGTPFADTSGPNGGVGDGTRGPENAFDGNPLTYYESQSPTGYVGLHLPAPSVITKIVFVPRQYAGGGMVGDVFEGSASGQEGDWHLLAAITQQPSDTQPNGNNPSSTLTVTDPSAYRWGRLRDTQGNHVRLVDIQFWGYAVPGGH